MEVGDMLRDWAYKALSMIEREHETDEGTNETTSTESCAEESEVPVTNYLKEKIFETNEDKRTVEDPLKIREENTPAEEPENRPEENPENGENPENEEKTNDEEEKKSEISSSSSSSNEEEVNEEVKKSDMITLPFIGENEEKSEENSENPSSQQDSEGGKTEEPARKPKKSRKQEIVTLRDVDVDVRGILPDYDTSVVYEIIRQLPTIRRCIIEHSYFKNQLYNANIYDINDLLKNETSRTLPYQNKRRETIEGECLSVETLDSSTSDPSDLLQVSTRSSFESERPYEEDYTESEEDDESDLSDEEMMKEMKTVRRVPILPRPPELIKIGNSSSAVSLDEIDKELSEVESLINKRKVEMPKLTRMRSVGERNINIPVEMPHLRKMAEIRNSDIDEILAKVSEMNAKNLTKALEREKFRRADETQDSAPDSPRKSGIKVKTVENINEELIKNRSVLLKPGENPKNLEEFNSKIIKEKKFIVPFGFKTDVKTGTFFRVLNSGVNGDKVLQVLNKEDGPTKPKLVMYPYITRNGKKLVVKSPEKSFPVKSVEQKIVPPPPNRRFVKLVPYETQRKIGNGKPEAENGSRKLPKVKPEMRKTDAKKQVSLWGFSNILKSILPEGWLVSMDPRFGLQVLKTQMDGNLNPSVMISVVVGRSGKIRVNVRGRPLEKNHEIFSNIGDLANAEGRVSIFYVLSLIEKLKMYGVCSGSDDLTLQKYWTEDGTSENQPKTFRSETCELLIHSSRKKCYSCHRLWEKLKKDQRKDQLEKKESSAAPEELPAVKSLKRNLEEEDFEESFMSIKRKITDEIEKRKADVSEKVPKTQEEVLSFMGLTRKDTLEQTVRKSKREKKNFQKFEPNDINVSQLELDFLEKYWTDINTLFSTSLLFGAYSRTGSGRLRAKCILFHQILKKWQKIIRDNPDWIGSDLVINDQTLESNETIEELFGKMDMIDLRKYLMNAVREIGKVKSRLKAKNSYFKCLYNKYVKRRAKRQKKDHVEPCAADITDESSREKDDRIFADSSGNQELIMGCYSDDE